MYTELILTLISVLLAIAITILTVSDGSESDDTVKLCNAGALASAWLAVALQFFANYSFLRVTGAYGPVVILSLLFALTAGALCIFAIWHSREEIR